MLPIFTFFYVLKQIMKENKNLSNPLIYWTWEVIFMAGAERIELSTHGFGDDDPKIADPAPIPHFIKTIQPKSAYKLGLHKNTLICLMHNDYNTFFRK